MPRIAPDGYDVLVLPLNDGPGTHVNYGTAGTDGNWTDYGSPVSGAQGLFGDAIYIPGSIIISSVRNGAGGGNDVTASPNASLSGWVFMRKYPSVAGEIFNKQNVVRPLSYFKEIYTTGALPLNLSLLTQYYKLRAYDTSCVTPTPVVWVDTQISLANAPAFPCSGPYSAVEVLDTWMV